MGTGWVVERMVRGHACHAGLLTLNLNGFFPTLRCHHCGASIHLSSLPSLILKNISPPLQASLPFVITCPAISCLAILKSAYRLGYRRFG